LKNDFAIKSSFDRFTRISKLKVRASKLKEERDAATVHAAELKEERDAATVHAAELKEQLEVTRRERERAKELARTSTSFTCGQYDPESGWVNTPSQVFTKGFHSEVPKLYYSAHLQSLHSEQVFAILNRMRAYERKHLSAVVNEELQGQVDRLLSRIHQLPPYMRIDEAMFSDRLKDLLTMSLALQEVDRWLVVQCESCCIQPPGDRRSSSASVAQVESVSVQTSRRALTNEKKKETPENQGSDARTDTDTDTDKKGTCKPDIAVFYLAPGARDATYDWPLLMLECKLAAKRSELEQLYVKARAQLSLTTHNLLLHPESVTHLLTGCVIFCDARVLRIELNSVCTVREPDGKRALVEALLLRYDSPSAQQLARFFDILAHGLKARTEQIRRGVRDKLPQELPVKAVGRMLDGKQITRSTLVRTLGSDGNYILVKVYDGRREARQAALVMTQVMHKARNRTNLSTAQILRGLSDSASTSVCSAVEPSSPRSSSEAASNSDSGCSADTNVGPAAAATSEMALSSGTEEFTRTRSGRTAEFFLSCWQAQYYPGDARSPKLPECYQVRDLAVVVYREVPGQIAPRTITALQVFHALKRLHGIHAAGLIHGDVRLANLVVAEPPLYAWWIDFDFTCRQDSPSRYPCGYNKDLTDTRRHPEIQDAAQPSDVSMKRSHDIFSAVSIFGSIYQLANCGKHLQEDWTAAVQDVLRCAVESSEHNTQYKKLMHYLEDAPQDAVFKLGGVLSPDASSSPGQDAGKLAGAGASGSPEVSPPISPTKLEVK